jgi:small conductance mechanosensitive channel
MGKGHGPELLQYIDVPIQNHAGLCWPPFPSSGSKRPNSRASTELMSTVRIGILRGCLTSILPATLSRGNRMHTISLTSIRSLLTLFALALVSTGALAQDCADDHEPVTDSDAAVPLAVLSYRVKPLTKCELDVEAQAWQALLRAKVAEISDAEVAEFFKKEEIKTVRQAESALQKAEEAAAESDEEAAREAATQAREALRQAQEAERKSVQDDAAQSAIMAAADNAEEAGKAVAVAGDDAEDKAELKTALVEYVTELSAQRTAIIDRLEVVLTELAAKGGDRTQYDVYIKAVSGIKVDVTDASATWTTISGWLQSPEGGIRWAVNILQFLFIIFVFYLLSVLAAKAAGRALARSKSLSSLLSKFIVISVRRLILFAGFFVGLSALEVNVGPVLAIVGAAGFVIAFALQNSLSNFASGILMLVYRPFDMGDFVNVAGVLGKVESMNLLSTQLRMPDNQLVIVPNNSVWGDVITNITGITERRVDLVFGIGYGDDIDKAQAILETIVGEHELVLKDPAPVIKLHELADSSVNFVCRPWVRPPDYWTVYWDVTREVKRRFDAEGVSIPFPQRDVHVYQASGAAV